ncbi:single-stranded DNA-binding protein [Streptomyces sp. NPDC053560]|uniref:single-stranded DNA-binding protein n=1 Tax=Streptomyces sp. NPDC053560 TaxID=3365711 RepID=UPI0037CE6A9F
MTDTMVTLTGNAATAVEHRYTKDGAAAARFRMACTPRRFDREQGRWTDGPTSFYTVRAWRTLADNLAASVAVGEPLLVRGRLTMREGEHPPERGGGRWFAAEVDAVAIGHDLTRGTAAFRRAARTTALSGTDFDATTSAAASTPNAATGTATATAPTADAGAGQSPDPRTDPGTTSEAEGNTAEGATTDGNTTDRPQPESGPFTNGTPRSVAANDAHWAGIDASVMESDSPEKVPVS